MYGFRKLKASAEWLDLSGTWIFSHLANIFKLAKHLPALQIEEISILPNETNANCWAFLRERNTSSTNQDASLGVSNSYLQIIIANPFERVVVNRILAGFEANRRVELLQLAPDKRGTIVAAAIGLIRCTVAVTNATKSIG